MEKNAAIKVGALTLLTLGLLGAVITYLSHLNPNSYLVKVHFQDTRGLQPQGVVRLRGVPVGEVQKIELVNYQPVVTLSIKKNQDIPSDSAVRIMSGILITNPQVQIEPNGGTALLAKDNTAEINGAETSSPLASLDPNLGEMVVKLNHSFSKLDTRLDEATNRINLLLKKSTGLVDNLNSTVTASRTFLLDPRMKTQLLATLDNFRQVSASAKDTSGVLSTELTRMVKKSGGNVDKLTTRLFDILAKIDTTMETANTVVNKLTEQVTDPRLQSSLRETTELASATLARFNQIASDLHQITGDPQLQSDLKETVSNLRSATDNGRQAVQRVNDIIGNVSGIAKTRSFKLPKVDMLANVSESLDPSRLRVDLEARFGITPASMLNLGLFDLGQNTRLTLQAGNRPSSSVLFRYGIYASKLGGGFEWEPRRGTGFRADLYDTSRTRLDFRALYGVNNQASVWIGADGIFQKPTPMIGLQIRQ